MTTFEFKFTKPGKSKGEKSAPIARVKNKSSTLQAASSTEEATKPLKKALKTTVKANKFPKKKLINEQPKENFKLAPEPATLVRRKRKKEQKDNNTFNQSEEPTTTFKKPTHSLFSEKYKSVHINTKIKGASLTEKVFSAGKKFDKLELHPHMLSNLTKHDFTILTNVQEKAIPVILSGQNCLVSCTQ